MIRVVATGTFDILHPGHLWYLEQSRGSASGESRSPWRLI